MIPLVDLQGVSVVRDGKAILDNVSLQINPGQHTAILGPNGSGKSTLIRLLAHEIYPVGGRGHALIDGKERWSVQELRQVLGMVSPDVGLKSLGDPTVEEMAVSGLLGTLGVIHGYSVSYQMWEQAYDALRQVEVEHLQGRTFGSLSTGEQRRTLIARALAAKPKGLILDEPTSGLDMKATALFLELLEKLMNGGVTTIVVTHHLEEVTPKIEQVVMIKEGRILGRGLRDQMLDPNKIADIYDVPKNVAAARLNYAQEALAR